jgi:hypothetical protein
MKLLYRAVSERKMRCGELKGACASPAVASSAIVNPKVAVIETHRERIFSPGGGETEA